MHKNPQKLTPADTSFDAPESLSIQDFARLYDVTPRTLRFYESKGLLSPGRVAGGRIFGPEEHIKFEQILRAKRLGFTLDDIKLVFDVAEGNINSAEELAAHRQSFERAIKSLKRRRKDIDIVASEMTQLCSQIDARLDAMPRPQNVTELAKAYHSALDQHLYHGGPDAGLPDNDTD